MKLTSLPKHVRMRADGGGVLSAELKPGLKVLVFGWMAV